MHPLNPFLRAFFRSTLPSQCSPIHHHVLLVPTTEALLSARDRESHTLYSDLAGTEEFLASHVLRVPGGVALSNSGKDGASFRDNRGKAKQYTTVNGRTVIVKDAFVYSNKGFKTLNQAQLLYDVIYYPDTFDAPAWLVYYISRPLVGAFEPVSIVPAKLPAPRIPNGVPPSPSKLVNGSTSSLPRKKEVKSFSELLNHFPMIARQMHPGLDRLFKEFGKELEKPLPPIPERPTAVGSSRRNSMSSTESLPVSFHSGLSNGSISIPSALELDDEEDNMRRALETAVVAAIDLFQMVDKQQLSLLGATTDLTGPIVERMIERYVTEQVHHSILFPRICSIRRSEDQELESRIRQMVDIDISQVGIAIGNGQRGKKELAIRLSKGVDVFKRMGVAGSPQEMMELLLATQKIITMPEGPPRLESRSLTNGFSEAHSEKQDPMLTINADTLVSLLLIVVIRSPIRHLKARLSYMRHFIFVDDVESGEMGYALSTFEAVLSYLARNSAGLRKSSRRNRRLWQATRTGNIEEMKSILEPIHIVEDAVDEPDEILEDDSESEIRSNRSPSFPSSLGGTTLDGDSENDTCHRLSSAEKARLEPGPLAHVFPFQRAQTPPIPAEKPKIKKRVSMETSVSSSSGFSFRSRTNTLDSHMSALEGDTSIEKLSQTQGPEGESVLMMAVESKQEGSLSYLLSLEEFYSLDLILEDCNNEGTTLLSAAVQIGHSGVVDLLLDFILDHSSNNDVVINYLAAQDSKGRCVAHYLFNQPRLIPRIGMMLPWRLKDQNGQTPLFALCRSYDHEEYHWMVDAALSAATESQGDGQPLHLDDHIDNKGNTLLHIINDAQMALRLLYHCDSDVNAANDKQFTPLMVASKYGRTDMVRAFFGDARVDLSAKDLRGLTAVELAKDDEVRNRIDDLVLLSNTPSSDGRTTTVVRSYFVEDGSIRLVLKSGAPNDNATITVTTCRRSFTDFENLAKWLAVENPASWLPSNLGFTSPFLIPSKPSRSILRDMQIRLDGFLKILLSHPTFSTHEMVWEFFLVPEIEPTMLAERSKRLAEARAERVREEYTPVSDVREVELFVQHARESVRSVHHSTKSVLRRVNKIRYASADLSDAASLASTALSTIEFLPQAHKTAFGRYVKTLAQTESSPVTGFYYNMHAIWTTVTAILNALNRPSNLISSMAMAQKAIDRHKLSLRRSDRWPLGLLDETRHRMQRDAAEKVEKSEMELESLGKELRYTQQTVAAELAAWQDGKVKMGRQACRELAKRMIVVEKARLEGMKRAMRGLGLRLKEHGREDGGSAE